MYTCGYVKMRGVGGEREAGFKKTKASGNLR